MGGHTEQDLDSGSKRQNSGTLGRNKRECRRGSILRLLAADGSFVPVPARAEVLLFGPHDLLQGAHIGPGGGGPRGECEKVGKGESKGGGAGRWGEGGEGRWTKRRSLSSGTTQEIRFVPSISH